MSFLNFFKKKQEKERKEVKKVAKPEPKKKEKVSVIQKPKKAKKIVSPVKSQTEAQGRDKKIKPQQQRKKTAKLPEVYRWLKEPHVTEKATDLSGLNKYTFKVLKQANKIEIARAVEGFYSVSVVGVNIINIHRKKRRLRRQEGWKSGYKKAIVTLKEGDKIEVLPH